MQVPSKQVHIPGMTVHPPSATHSVPSPARSEEELELEPLLLRLAAFNGHHCHSSYSHLTTKCWTLLMHGAVAKAPADLGPFVLLLISSCAEHPKQISGCAFSPLTDPSYKPHAAAGQVTQTGEQSRSQELSNALFYGCTCRSFTSTNRSLLQPHSGCSLPAWSLSSRGRSVASSKHTALVPSQLHSSFSFRYLPEYCCSKVLTSIVPSGLTA